MPCAWPFPHNNHMMLLLFAVVSEPPRREEDRERAQASRGIVYEGILNTSSKSSSAPVSARVLRTFVLFVTFCLCVCTCVCVCVCESLCIRLYTAAGALRPQASSSFAPPRPPLSWGSFTLFLRLSPPPLFFLLFAFFGCLFLLALLLFSPRAFTTQHRRRSLSYRLQLGADAFCLSPRHPFLSSQNHLAAPYSHRCTRHSPFCHLNIFNLPSLSLFTYPTMSTNKIIVNVTSDVACPWCWVGKRAIEAAAASLNASRPNSPFELELHWRPFQLDPEMKPNETTSFLQHLVKVFGNPRVVEQWTQHPETIPMNRSCAASHLPNIEFHYTEKNVKFSTYRAHTLLTYAGPIQKNWSSQNRLKEAMLRMTHKEGKNLDNIDSLVAAAQEAGVAQTRQEVEAILSDAAVTTLLDKELREARRLPQFDGVPYFAFPNGKSFSGGQPVEVFEAVLSEVLKEV
jgi:predicted DsbA family dithiol-disulfide isomerase